MTLRVVLLLVLLLVLIPEITWITSNLLVQRSQLLLPALVVLLFVVVSVFSCPRFCFSTSLSLFCQPCTE